MALRLPSYGARLRPRMIPMHAWGGGMNAGLHGVKTGPGYSAVALLGTPI
jgi:hypothetical protein